MRADDEALLIDHARHRGERDERGHEEEDEGKDLRYLVHALRVGLEAGRALVFRAVEHVEVRGLHGVDVGLRGGYLALGVGELGVGLAARGLVLRKAGQPLRVTLLPRRNACIRCGDAVGVGGKTCGKLHGGLFYLGGGGVELCLGGIEFGLGLRAALGHLRQGGRARRTGQHARLRLGGVEFFFCLGALRGQLRAGGIELGCLGRELLLIRQQLRARRVQRLLALHELFLRGVKLCLRGVQLGFGLVELLVGLVALALEIGFLLVELRLGICLHRRQAHIGQTPLQSLDAACHLPHARIICI